MWELTHPWWEFIFRAVILYGAVFLLFRIGGKKQIGEMSPFDLVLLLIVSESISEAITGGDESLTAGLIAVTSFITLNYLMDVWMFKSSLREHGLDRLEDVVYAVLETNGKISVIKKRNDASPPHNPRMENHL